MQVSNWGSRAYLRSHYPNKFRHSWWAYRSQIWYSNPDNTPDEIKILTELPDSKWDPRYSPDEILDYILGSRLDPRIWMSVKIPDEFPDFRFDAISQMSS